MSEADARMATASVRTMDRIRPGDHVVVVGGGPAGLTAAYLLSKKGYRTTVFEGEDILGGISQTARYKGFRFDIGGHRFFTKIRPVEELWHELLGEELLAVPRLSRIRYRDRFFHYPLKPMNALRGLGLWTSFLCGLSYVRWHFRPYPKEENLEEWVTNRFGRRLYKIFFKTYTEKVWGVPCTEIRAEWAAQRIKGLSLARAILAAAPRRRRAVTIKSLIDEFRYPRLGPGQMWERCAERIRERGNDVCLGHYVSGIVMEAGRVRAVRVRSTDGERTVACDHVISSMPLRDLVRVIEPALPPEAHEAAEGLTYRDFLVVALILEGEDLFPDNWIYVHTPGVKVGRVQNFKNWSAAMVPEPSRTCLGMEYFCFEGDGLWSASDADLVALATRELAKLDLAPNAPVVDGTVVRMRKAYPVYDGTYKQNVARVRSHIDGIPNLHTVGRNGMHKYNNQDHSMLTAMMTVWNMEGASHDIWSVNTDFEYQEEKRVLTPTQGTAPSSPAASVGS